MSCAAGTSPAHCTAGFEPVLSTGLRFFQEGENLPGLCIDCPNTRWRARLLAEAHHTASLQAEHRSGAEPTGGAPRVTALGAPRGQSARRFRGWGSATAPPIAAQACGFERALCSCLLLLANRRAGGKRRSEVPCAAVAPRRGAGWDSPRRHAGPLPWGRSLVRFSSVAAGGRRRPAGGEALRCSTMQRASRLKRELMLLTTEPPPGITCWQNKSRADDLRARTYFQRKESKPGVGSGANGGGHGYGFAKRPGLCTPCHAAAGRSSGGRS